MDIHFFLPNTVKELCDLGISIIGTARYQRGWPPKPMQAIKEEKIEFSHFTGQLTILELSWLDGWIMALFLASTVHLVGN